MSSQEPSAEDLLGWILASGGTSQDRAFKRPLSNLLVGEHSLVLICPFLWTPLDSSGLLWSKLRPPGGDLAFPIWGPLQAQHGALQAVGWESELVQ